MTKTQLERMIGSIQYNLDEIKREGPDHVSEVDRLRLRYALEYLGDTVANLKSNREKADDEPLTVGPDTDSPVTISVSAPKEFLVWFDDGSATSVSAIGKIQARHLARQQVNHQIPVNRIDCLEK